MPDDAQVAAVHAFAPGTVERRGSIRDDSNVAPVTFPSRGRMGSPAGVPTHRMARYVGKRLLPPRGPDHENDNPVRHFPLFRIHALLAIPAALFGAAGCIEGPEPRSADGASPTADAEALSDIGLVVYVVVDQLRADLLDRCDTAFTGGFARLRAEGLRFPNATFDHAQTSTSPGHGTASTVPAWAESMSRPDTFPYEGDGVNSWFPHRAELEAGASERALNGWRGAGPWPDVAVLELAREAVSELGLGGRNGADYLALALSQVDRVGHAYSPLSREQLDNLLRLDRGLGAFFAFLDGAVGEGRWIAALTADHGVLELPEARADLGLFGRRISPDERRAMVARAEAAHERGLAEAAASDGNVDAALLAARAAASTALEEDWIEDAFAWEDLIDGTPADTLQALFLHSWHPERRLGPLAHLGVAIRTGEGVLSGRYPFGTGHGSPYYHDRHVPFVLLAPGLRSGVDPTRVSVVDLAPTLAELVKVSVPEDLDGVSRLRIR